MRIYTILLGLLVFVFAGVVSAAPPAGNTRGISFDTSQSTVSTGNNTVQTAIDEIADRGAEDFLTSCAQGEAPVSTGIGTMACTAVEFGAGTTTVVDITNAVNPCQSMQDALNEYLDDNTRVANKQYHVVFKGKNATPITDDEFHVMRHWTGASISNVNSPYRVCVSLALTGGDGPGVTGGYPVPDAPDTIPAWNQFLHIEFDDLRLVYDPDEDDDGVEDCSDGGPTVGCAHVGFDLGGGYMAGQGDAQWNGGLAFSGMLSIEVVDDGRSSPAWGDDRPVPLTSDSLVESDSSFIGVLVNGITKPTGNFVYNFDGHSEDDDDIALLNIDSYGLDWFRGHLRKCGAACIQVYGNVSTTFDGFYFSWSPKGTDIQFGDGVNGATPVFWDNCFGFPASNCGDNGCTGNAGNCGVASDARVNEFVLSDSTVEGTDSSPNVLLFEGGRSEFRNNHFEHGVGSDNILIGAGICDGSSTSPKGPGQACANDGHCGAGTCVCPAGDPQWFNMKFIGNNWSDNGGDDDFDTIHLGKCATVSASPEQQVVHFSDTIGTSGNDSELWFVAEPESTLAINFDGSTITDPAADYPKYPYIRSRNVIQSHEFWINDPALFDNPDVVRSNAFKIVPGESNLTTCLGAGAVDSQYIAPKGKWFVNYARIVNHRQYSTDQQCTWQSLVGPYQKGSFVVASQEQWPNASANARDAGSYLQDFVGYTLNNTAAQNSICSILATDDGSDLCSAPPCSCDEGLSSIVYELIGYPHEGN